MWLRSIHRLRTLRIIVYLALMLLLCAGYYFTHPHGEERAHFLPRRSYEMAAFQLTAAQLLNAAKRSNKNFSCATIPKSEDAKSAITRATSSRCQHDIEALSCADELRVLYPQSLPQLCPYRVNVTKSYIGCFKDTKSDRDLDGLMISLDSNNSPSACSETCFVSGYIYAGLQNGHECWCGDTYGKHGQAYSDGLCSMPCPGNSNASCGSSTMQSIYRTGIGVKVRNTADHVRGPVVLDADFVKPVRILFMLTLNGRALRQVKRLIKAIYHVNHYYYIHVDSRQEYLHRELSHFAMAFANMRIVPDDLRLATIWGGASLLQMLLKSMESALQMDDWHWDFFLNLSESDFPIKRIEDLTAFLSTNRNYNFLKSHGPNTPRFIRKQGLDRTFYECEHRMWRVGDRALPTGIRIDGGSDWICLNREFVHYVVHSTDDLVIGLKQYFKYTLLPAESFFHTVLQNSVFCATHVDNNLHKTNWNRAKGCQCQYKHIVDWCGCSPSTFTTSDLYALKDTGRKAIYFARKFEAIISNQVVNMVESWISDTITNDVPALSSYWQNEFHASDTAVPSDDTPYSFYRSFARVSVLQLMKSSAGTTDACRFAVTGVQSAHLFYENDVFSGLLIMFEASRQSGEPGRTLIESYMKPSNTFHVVDSQGIARHLRRFEVGSSYDVKEHVFRNHASLLGPHSDIVLVHWWTADGEELDLGTIHFVFYDPYGTLALVVPSKVLATAGHRFVGVHSVGFAKPMLPGIWRCLLIRDNQTIASIEYLIVPYSHIGRRVLANAADAATANGGTDIRYNVSTEHGAQFGHSRYSPDQTQLDGVSMAKQNSVKVGSALFGWIDGLTSQFWALQSMCELLPPVAASSAKAGQCDVLPNCSSAYWSSASPDPKSGWDHIDNLTGRMNHVRVT